MDNVQKIIKSLDPLSSISAALAIGLFTTPNFKDAVLLKLLTYKTVLLKTDLANIKTKFLDPMRPKVEAWRMMTQKYVDPSVSSNISTAVGLYAFLFFIICILSFAGVGVGLVYYRPEVKPHHRKNNQVIGGTLLTAALYMILVFSWGAMIATAYLMVYASQLDGALCGALSGESTGFSKLRTGVKAMEANATDSMKPINNGTVNITLDWGTCLLNCKKNSPAHTGLNMSAFWSPDDVKTHFDVFGFNTTFSNMTFNSTPVSFMDEATAQSQKDKINAAIVASPLDPYFDVSQLEGYISWQVSQLVNIHK
ncbi:hypothetical protein RvY_03580-4 [Ramazzottius varieornatus]|uniref:Uncharacterized protein n=1 Tax=Ramazzottius varieornatus TaxID=947166 RepID=A0A1D1URY6_RAMVA|nr:hypothetical protein RvY_03580-4 [Ramazzottius varieornatus]